MRPGITNLDGLTIINDNETIDRFLNANQAILFPRPEQVNGSLVRRVVFTGPKLETRRPVLPEGIRYGLLADWDDKTEVAAMRTQVKQAKHDGYTNIHYLFKPLNSKHRAYPLTKGTVGMKCRRARSGMKTTEEGVFVGYLAMQEGTADGLWNAYQIDAEGLLSSLHDEREEHNAPANKQHDGGIGVLVNNVLVAGFWSNKDIDLTLDHIVNTYGAAN